MSLWSLSTTGQGIRSGHILCCRSPLEQICRRACRTRGAPVDNLGGSHRSHSQQTACAEQQPLCAGPPTHPGPLFCQPSCRCYTRWPGTHHLCIGTPYAHVSVLEPYRREGPRFCEWLDAGWAAPSICDAVWPAAHAAACPCHPCSLPRPIEGAATFAPWPRSQSK